MSIKKCKFNYNKNKSHIFVIFLIILIFCSINSVCALDDYIDENSQNEMILDSNNDLNSDNLNLASDKLDLKQASESERNVISTNSEHNVSSFMSNDDIQFIFDNSKEGDTIQFNDREYSNVSIIVDKKLNIVSEHNSIIHTSDSKNERAIKAGIMDSFAFYFTELASGSIIKGLSLEVNSDYGIMVKGANGIQAKGNNIIGAKKAGIFFENSSSSVIMNNTISKGYDGLILESVNRTKIANNNIHSNKNIGLLMENVFLNNITKNSISKNKLDGFVLKNAKSNRILNNSIVKNANSGLRLEGNTTRNVIQYNNISENAMNIYANSLTNGDIITHNTLMYAKRTFDTYTSLDNTGAAIVFAENYSSSKYGNMLFERNSIGFNEQWDAKSTMEHPAVDIGANWYFDNDGNYGLGHICPMVFGKALSMEDFKHLSMGFGGDENGIFGQLYDGENPSGAGAFTIDNLNINGKDYGAMTVAEDGRFYLNDLDLDELPSGSVITIRIGEHSFKISIDDKVFSNRTNESGEFKRSGQETDSNQFTEDEKKVPVKESKIQKSTGNGTGSGSGSNRGSGSGEGNFTGSGIAVGEISGQSNAGTGDSGENGGGSASDGINAYELLKQEQTPATAKNSQMIALFGVALVILIIALGYRSKNKDDFQDDGDYSL